MSVTEMIGKHKIKARFILVGVWNTFFGYAMFVVLDSLLSLLLSKRYLAYMSATVLANILSVLNAFISHKYVTFKSHAKGKNMVFEFLKFCTTYLLSFFLTLAALPFFVEIVRIPPKAAGALIIPVVTVVSYVAHSRFSFKNRHAAVERDT